MNIRHLYKHNVTLSPNEFGETPLPFAPKVMLESGESVVPQQYLEVVRNVQNLEAIIKRISFADEYLFFAGETNGALYLQVGVIGRENYRIEARHHDEVKIVYGRRWLIEPTTPTSEVVQTAMLAVKKAREHECREKIFKFINNGRNKTTPFNSHMDLPQMSGNSNRFNASIKTLQQQIDDLVTTIKINTLGLALHSIHSIDDTKVLVGLQTVESAVPEHDFPELVDQCLFLLCDSQSSTDLAHELMAELVKRSDRYIEENFKFNDFARFSREISVSEIAKFSYESRNIAQLDERFDIYFRDMSDKVDSSKVPPFASGELGVTQLKALERAGVNAGYPPLEGDAPKSKARIEPEVS